MAAIQRLPDDVTMDEALRQIRFIQEIEKSIREADAGLGTPHEEFMAELLSELDDE